MPDQLSLFTLAALPENFSMIILWVAVSVFSALFVMVVLMKLYKRASKEVSFVRTGMGGEKVIMNGGSLVVPVVHEIILVNMNTLRLEVQRGAEAALITRDRMRVDVKAEFYVRVKPTQEAIAIAAQTLGRRTMDPDALKELVEGKFVDALRAVAAGMAMEELHENRVDFVQKVQAAVAEDLAKNGLELEAVSLTSLDQTDQSFFNPQNAFDAQGLTKLTEEIQNRRKQRNDIERDTEVLVAHKNLTTEKQKLEIRRDEDYARLLQEREVAVRRATEAAVTAEQEAEKRRQAEEARIASKQRVDMAQILAERAVEEERIEKERLLKEKDIQRFRSIETTDIERQKAIKLADQDRAIAIAERSKAQSQAEALADEARALAVRAEEKVTTAKEAEIAERNKIIVLVRASEEAERDAIGVTVAAEADRRAAEDRAHAVRTIANADADKVRIAAEAAQKQYAVDAEGRRALHMAENVLDPGIIAMRVKLSIIEHLDKIIAESVKPMQAIDGIKIIHVDGLGMGSQQACGNDGARGASSPASGNGGSGGSGVSGGGNLAEQVVNSALRYRGQAPLIDALLQEVGLAADLQGLTAPLRDRRTDPAPATPPSPQQPMAAEAPPASPPLKAPKPINPSDQDDPKKKPR